MLALIAPVLPVLAPAPASAVPGPIELQSAYVAPISGTEPRCTPEPGGRLAYGTQAPFNPAQPITSPTGIATGYPGSVDYVPANMPSTDSIQPVLQAGASSDLCVGFTLPPNMEPGFVRDAGNANGRRYQETPPLPDLDATRVLDGGDGDDLQDAVIDMPVGFLGDPDGAGQCSDEDFGAGNYAEPACAADTQVGTAYVRLSTLLGGVLKQHLALGGSPNGAGGFDGGVVYNLEHGPNELARLGVNITPVNGLAPTKFTVRLTFAPDGSGRIRAIAKDAPRHVYSNDDVLDGELLPDAIKQPLYVEAIGIRAWGAKADHPTLAKDFAEWGTDCTSPQQADVNLTTYGGTRSTATSPALTLTGCEALPFDPSVAVETAERRPGVPTATTVRVGLEQTASGLKSALLKDATVTLPTGLEIGAQAGSKEGGLTLCTAAEFAVDQPLTPAGCEAGTRAGEVTITTPLQTEPFVGQVFLGEQPQVGKLPALYLEAAPQGATAADAPRIKIAGSVTVDDAGRLTTTFKDAPQLRFSELKLDFPGGPAALFRTPRQCGTTTGAAAFVSRASSTPVQRESTLTIDQDCDLPGFAPDLGMTVETPVAGASSPTTVAITRADRTPWLDGIRVSLPAGFLADLKAATECPGAETSLAICPESSRIASVRTVAGVGPAPIVLDGAMYLTTPQPGAVAGAAIVVRAKIGELDLGTVNVPARIDLRPTDAGLVLSTNAPIRFQGLALELRQIAVRLDRPGFPLNPTACGPLAAAGEFTGDGGQTAAKVIPVEFTGCAARPFQPGFAATLTGETEPSGHPQVNVTMTPRPGDSNLSAATVTLPAGVSTDLKNLQSPCLKEAFDAATCPPGTRVGSARATVSITDDVISGDVYLVKVPGQTLPGLGMSFTGRYSQRVLSTVRIDRSSRVVTEFGAIPDLPLTRLDLVVDGGPRSPIQLSPRACTTAASWDGVLTGQGGQRTTVSVPFTCGSPIPDLAPTLSTKTGLRLTVKASGGERIRYVKVTMGSDVRLQTSRTLTRYLFSSGTGGKVSERRRSSKSFFVSGSGATRPTAVTMRLALKAVRLPARYRSGLKSGARIQVRVRVVLQSGEARNQTITVRAR
ncbi:MAG: hypothetical protein JHD16_04110 [Solirubrobacteraceae bacterium]|nr:hypothetical protein [Solirubrobacteraceae bacterium]